MSLARCTYACVNILVIRFNPGSNSAYNYVYDCWCLQSTYFMLHHHFKWSYCSVYMLHIGPTLPDLLLAWPQHQGRKLCVQHMLNIAWHDCTYFQSSAVGVSHLSWKRSPHQTMHWQLLPFWVTLDHFLQRSSCHIISLLMFSLLFLCDASVFS